MYCVTSIIFDDFVCVNMGHILSLSQILDQIVIVVF